MLNFALVVGLGAAVGLWRLARNSDDPERWLDAALLGLAGALMGGRLGFAALHAPYFSTHLGEIPQVWLGGLSAAGALAGGLAGVLAGLKLLGLPPGEGLDRFGLALAPLASAAWLGCWLAGTAYGLTAPVGAGWGLPGPDESGAVLGRFPLQPLAALTLVAGLAVVEQALPGGKPGKGGLPTGALSLAWLGLHLLLFSLLRVDPRPGLDGGAAGLWTDPDAWAGAVFALLGAALTGLEWRRRAADEETEQS